MWTQNVTVLLVEYKRGNALMVWSLTLSVVLFCFRGLNVVVVGVLVCLLGMASWHFANTVKPEKDIHALPALHYQPHSITTNHTVHGIILAIHTALLQTTTTTLSMVSSSQFTQHYYQPHCPWYHPHNSHNTMTIILQQPHAKCALTITL